MNVPLPQLHILPETADHYAVLGGFCASDQECIWVNQPEEKLSIELVRNLQEKLQFLPLTSHRIVLIAHLETASLPAQQSLLKLLEEPPAQTRLYLSSTSLGPVLPTIQSRCVISSEPQEDDLEGRQKGAELYQRLATATIPDILKLSGELKERTAAEAACRDVLCFLHAEYLSRPFQEQQQMTARTLALLKSLDLLASNVAPRLVLEDMWLKW